MSQGLNRTTVKAQHVIIATGSRIADLPIPGIHGRNVLNSTTALDLEEDFDSIAIVGGGVIGMEFAGIYAPWASGFMCWSMRSRFCPPRTRIWWRC